MIIPTSYSEEWDENHRYMSYEEKKQKELDRLEFEYGGKENNEGGPPTEELIDFQQLRLDAIRDMEYGVIELDEVIEIKVSEVQEQNKVIVQEQKAIAAAKELLKKEWGAPQVDTTKLNLENKKLLKLNNELGELVAQKDLVLKEIETKKMIYDIQKHDAKLIGVELSSTCIKLAKLNMTSSCPTYEDLYNLDNSITQAEKIPTLKEPENSFLCQSNLSCKDSYKVFRICKFPISFFFGFSAWGVFSVCISLNITDIILSILTA